MFHYNLFSKYQGDETLDTDIPTDLEAKLFNTTGGKILWLFLQPLFYALRPVIVYPKPPTILEIINVIIQLTFDAVVFYLLGQYLTLTKIIRINIIVEFFIVAGAKALFYLVGGSLLAMGVHPVAGHFVAEHYMFAKGYETYSYYGPLNWITFNVGYHNEHHDFPAVPGSRLPQVIFPSFLKRQFSFEISINF